MSKEEIATAKLLISGILFKNNVPVSDAKIVGSLIEYLENKVNTLEDELEWYKQQCDDLEMEIGCSHESE